MEDKGRGKNGCEIDWGRIKRCNVSDFECEGSWP